MSSKCFILLFFFVFFVLTHFLITFLSAKGRKKRRFKKYMWFSYCKFKQMTYCFPQFFSIFAIIVSPIRPPPNLPFRLSQKKIMIAYRYYIEIERAQKNLQIEVVIKKSVNNKWLIKIVYISIRNGEEIWLILLVCCCTQTWVHKWKNIYYTFLSMIWTKKIHSNIIQLIWYNQ